MPTFNPNDTPGLPLPRRPQPTTLPGAPTVGHSRPTTVALPSGPALLTTRPGIPRAVSSSCYPIGISNRPMPFKIEGGIHPSSQAVTRSGLATTASSLAPGSMRAPTMDRDLPWMQDDEGDDGADALMSMAPPGAINDPMPAPRSNVGKYVPVATAAVGYKVAGVKGAIAGYILGKLFGREG